MVNYKVNTYCSFEHLAKFYESIYQYLQLGLRSCIANGFRVLVTTDVAVHNIKVL